MELTMTLDDLRGLEQYPGLQAQKSHISHINQKKIVHRDYHRHYTIVTYIYYSLFFLNRMAVGSRYSHCETEYL